MTDQASDNHDRSHLDAGYAEEYGEAALRGLPYVSFLGAALFAGFAIFDAFTHSSEDLAFRIGASLVPALALLAVGLLARTRFVTYQNAPTVGAFAAILAQCAPLATIIYTKHEIDLAYVLLIIAVGGVFIFRVRPFLIVAATSVLFYGISIGLLNISTDDRGDWICLLYTSDAADE